MIDIYVPTYKRQTFPAMSFLNDENIRLILCVRSEEDDNGFYDELKRHDRIEILRLGYDIVDIGDTRQRILQHCIDNNVKFCTMFDDQVIRLVSKSDAQPSKIIEKCYDSMMNDSLYDKIALFGFTTRRAYTSDFDYRDYTCYDYNETYFSDFPSQAVILNVDVISANSIQYHRLEEHGLEDCVFVADCLRQGLIFKFDPDVRKDSFAANSNKSGGNHTIYDNQEKIRNKYNRLQSKTYDEYCDLMGIIMHGRYRGYLGGNVMFVAFDWSYYREVLVEHRLSNQDLIDHKLSYNYFKDTYIKC